MKINRNPEVKKESIIFAVITAIFSAVCFCINTYSGILMFAAGLLFIIVLMLFAGRRYTKISEMADSIDRILHGQESIMVNDCNEGELAILNSEIHKMLVTLNEQSEMLKSEKNNLSNAIEDIFHQLRTPLTAMGLDTELLRKEELSYEKRVTLARNIKKQLERMRWLVEALLKMSKINAGTAVFVQEKVVMKDVIQKAAEPFLVQMEIRGQEFEYRVENESFTGDIGWTVEAIGNLIKNCMEHTPAGGKISINVLENALYTQIVVSDTGEGFCKEEIPYIFDRFYKGKNASSESIGIGLALTRSIIAAQNGVISASNNAAGGAEFTVKFYKCLTV